jgi:hypothetical protein
LNFVPSESRETSSIATNKNLLLHICDLYDTALGLLVLRILHHSHVQFFLPFAECDVCCAIARVIAEGKVRTYDMGGKASTLNVAKAIADYAG